MKIKMHIFRCIGEYCQAYPIVFTFSKWFFEKNRKKLAKFAKVVYAMSMGIKLNDFKRLWLILLVTFNCCVILCATAEELANPISTVKTLVETKKETWEETKKELDQAKENENYARAELKDVRRRMQSEKDKKARYGYRRKSEELQILESRASQLIKKVEKARNNREILEEDEKSAREEVEKAQKEEQDQRKLWEEKFSAEGKDRKDKEEKQKEKEQRRKEEEAAAKAAESTSSEDTKRTISSAGSNQSTTPIEDKQTSDEIEVNTFPNSVSTPPADTSKSGGLVLVEGQDQSVKKPDQKEKSFLDFVEPRVFSVFTPPADTSKSGGLVLIEGQEKSVKKPDQKGKSFLDFIGHEVLSSLGEERPSGESSYDIPSDPHTPTKLGTEKTIAESEKEIVDTERKEGVSISENSTTTVTNPDQKTAQIQIPAATIEPVNLPADNQKTQQAEIKRKDEEAAKAAESTSSEDTKGTISSAGSNQSTTPIEDKQTSDKIEVHTFPNSVFTPPADTSKSGGLVLVEGQDQSVKKPDQKEKSFLDFVGRRVLLSLGEERPSGESSYDIPSDPHTPTKLGTEKTIAESETRIGDTDREEGVSISENSTTTVTNPDQKTARIQTSAATIEPVNLPADEQKTQQAESETGIGDTERKEGAQYRKIRQQQ